ncbi:4-hydroxythreonine-4-phosphate dehydrogenase PdxA [Rhizobium sp. BK376]|uniref:PdxA family dehydrogenase n=1 Tax=Rhizobium sp. BK376 TaxID=2512149 RepID=UPI00104D6343|nr:4-hydroxythreonine-4-phosphate dehydrogenase PdxA [Rhizobium sp. BK376]TCR85870.1 4-hydroxythreonine-4-phosphate dehydrogenase [Rhizobium sp. BK376]
MASTSYAPTTLPRLALLLGDMTGIGPELVARVVSDRRLTDVARIAVFGDLRVLEMGARDAGVHLSVKKVADAAEIDWTAPETPVIDLGNIDPQTLPRGEVSPESGKLTGDTLAAAIRQSLEGKFEAITFAPLNKAALHAGGWKFPDEHKMFAHLLEHKGYFSEMNVLDGQWMSRVTSHVSLRTALDMITHDSIIEAIELVNRTMQLAGIENPRIAVAALNPHAGENGLFGREEIDLIGPAVRAAAETGIDCKGPFPSDTVYIKAFAGEYDSVVAMYHDQGQIATKLRGFNRGVTVTAGLDTVFTTPAHGTAFDIVGKGVASTGALESAVRLAAQLAGRKRNAAAN